MRSIIVSLLSLTLAGSLSTPQKRETLDIYAIDVEGGKATLMVSPSGESLLIDSGNIGNLGARRDAGRIEAAIHDAGLHQIDHLVTTHWHRDHVGAMPLLSERIPILEFIDHGPNVQPDPPVDKFLRDYPRLYAHAKHTVVKPGDRISLGAAEALVATSAGDTIKAPTETSAPNPYCADFDHQPVDKTENAQSIGLLVTFGKFRVLDLGDLLSNKEFELMCPANPFGSVDLFMVSRHGQPGSNSKVLVHAITARVAIMNNGTRKGGQPSVMETFHTAPGLEDLWQLHFSLLSGQEYSTPGMFIANRVDRLQPLVPVAPLPTPDKNEPLTPGAIHNGPANWIKVSAWQDGSFVVTNSRNHFSKTYKPLSR